MLGTAPRLALASFVLAAAILVTGCREKATADTGAPAVLTAATATVAEAEDAGAMDESAMPQSAGAELDARMKHLVEALAQDNPDLASDVVFPRDAYVSLRDTSDPQKAWEKRVDSAFRRSVAKTHKRVKGIAHAKFVSFEIGRSIVQMPPKRRDFKKPLWRVKHSKLTFTIDGKTRHLDIGEMVAWRGAWYVTRLR